MRALRDMNLPKFVFEDVPLFLGLISDLFPGLDCPRVRYPDFNDAVEAILEENNYVPLSHQVSLSDVKFSPHYLQLKTQFIISVHLKSSIHYKVVVEISPGKREESHSIHGVLKFQPKNTCVSKLIHIIYLFVHLSFIHTFMRLFIHSTIHSYIHAFIHSFVHSFNRSTK